MPTGTRLPSEDRCRGLLDNLTRGCQLFALVKPIRKNLDYGCSTAVMEQHIHEECKTKYPGTTAVTRSYPDHGQFTAEHSNQVTRHRWTLHCDPTEQQAHGFRRHEIRDSIFMMREAFDQSAKSSISDDDHEMQRGSAKDTSQSVVRWHSI